MSSILTASGAATYSWSNGLNTTSISVSPTITTSYSVIAVDNNTCTNSQVVTVSINPSPTVIAVSNTSLICSGQSSTLIAIGANTYTWSNNSNQSSIVINPSVTTIYTVTGSNASGCSNSAVITQSVNNCNGVTEFSKNQNTIVLAYPNPSSDKIIISSNREVKLNLVNGLGMVLKIIDLSLSNNFSQEINSFGSGLYFLISNENNVKHKIVFSN